MLGLFLAAAHVNAELTAAAYGGSATGVYRDAETQISGARGSPVRGISHDDLIARVYADEGQVLSEQKPHEGQTLMHPLGFYLAKFVAWASKHDVTFDNPEEAVRALKVRFYWVEVC